MREVTLLCGEVGFGPMLTNESFFVVLDHAKIKTIRSLLSKEEVSEDSELMKQVSGDKHIVLSLASVPNF